MSNVTESMQLIEAKNDLRKKVREVRSTGPGDDPVSRAEAALKVLSANFETWMAAEVDTIAARRDAWAENGFENGPEREAFYRSVHDVKGQAATLGFPLAAQVAGSLCHLLEIVEDPTKLPLTLIEQHVDAIRAIFREKAKAENDRIGSDLAATLQTVTTAFLVEHSKPLEH